MRYVYVPIFAANNRNVLFSPRSELLFKEMSIIAATEGIKKFTNTKFKKWIANNYPANKHKPSSRDPDWVAEAISRGDTVYYIDINDKDA